MENHMLFIGGHVLLVSLLGGAELERYLLPVLPLVYIAMGARGPWCVHSGAHRLDRGSLPVVDGLVRDPPYPFPLENNLGMVDFVELTARQQYFWKALTRLKHLQRMEITRRTYDDSNLRIPVGKPNCQRGKTLEPADTQNR